MRLAMPSMKAHGMCRLQQVLYDAGWGAGAGLVVSALRVTVSWLFLIMSYPISNKILEEHEKYWLGEKLGVGSYVAEALDP